MHLIFAPRKLLISLMSIRKSAIIRLTKPIMECLNVGRQAGALRKELPFKLRQDVLDGIRHLHEYSRDRLTFKSLKLAQRYVKGHLNVAVEFRRSGTVESYEAVFSRLPFGSVSIKTTGGILNDKSPCVDSIARNSHPDRDQIPVLFGPTEFIKAEDQIVRSLIWLDFSKEGRQFGTPPLYFSLFHLSFKTVLSIFNQEEEKVSLFGMESPCDRDRRVIQRLAQIGNDPSRVPQPDVGNGLGQHETVKYAAGLRNRNQGKNDRASQRRSF